MSYWDEFVRAPQQNRNRVCIRPEISRTLSWGAVGTSDGMFYDKFIKYIALNDEHVRFTTMDLSYLHKACSVAMHIHVDADLLFWPRGLTQFLLRSLIMTPSGSKRFTTRLDWFVQTENGCYLGELDMLLQVTFEEMLALPADDTSTGPRPGAPEPRRTRRCR